MHFYADPLNPTAEELAMEQRLTQTAQHLIKQLRQIAAKAHEDRDIALGEAKDRGEGLLLRRREYGMGFGQDVDIPLGEDPVIVAPIAAGGYMTIKRLGTGFEITSHSAARDQLVTYSGGASNQIHVGAIPWERHQ